jgi:tetratricopeptide (TPR) repeat protein
MINGKDNRNYLKACYLKGSALFRLADFRGVLDLSLEALNKAESKDDILSFMYLQAESYLQMGKKLEAKKVLTQILSIDSNYRLTRYRLEGLNEI